MNVKIDNAEQKVINEYVEAVAQSLKKLGVEDVSELLEELNAHLVSLINDGDERSFESILGTPSEYARELVEVSGFSMSHTTASSEVENPISTFEKFKKLSLTQKLLAAILAYFVIQFAISLIFALVLCLSSSPIYPGAKVLIVVLLIVGLMLLSYFKSKKASWSYRFFAAIDSIKESFASAIGPRWLVVTLSSALLTIWWVWRALYVFTNWTVVYQVTCDSNYSRGLLGWWSSCDAFNHLIIVQILISVALGIFAHVYKRWTVSRIFFLGLNFVTALSLIQFVYLLTSHHMTLT